MTAPIPYTKSAGQNSPNMIIPKNKPGTPIFMSLYFGEEALTPAEKANIRSPIVMYITIKIIVLSQIVFEVQIL